MEAVGWTAIPSAKADPTNSYDSASIYGRHSLLYSSSGSSTTYVPTNVTRDQYIYHAIFLRKMQPGEAVGK